MCWKCESRSKPCEHGIRPSEGLCIACEDMLNRCENEQARRWALRSDVDAERKSVAQFINWMKAVDDDADR